jgi:hypothetical protein
LDLSSINLKKRSFPSGCLFCAKKLLHVSALFLPHKDIQSHRNKKMFALTTQFAGVQVVSKTAAPKKSVNKVVSVRVFDCQYVYFDALSRALLVFAERFLFVRAFWKVNSLSRVFGSHTTRERNPHTRALKSTDYLLTTRLSSSHIIHR